MSSCCIPWRRTSPRTASQPIASPYTYVPAESLLRSTIVKVEPSSDYLDFIKDAIAHCNTAHANKCVPLPISSRTPEASPSYLIDVHKGCIVEGQLAVQSKDQYVALSYVWPKTGEHSTQVSHSLVLEQNNLVDFTRPGFFHSQGVVDNTPPVIKHAIALTRLLGENFLWVDRFCIIQDDTTAALQISHMNDIYGGAYLTVIAASEDAMFAEHVDASKWPVFAPESPHFRRLFSSESLVSMAVDNLYNALDKSQWATRGWTFQEQILSKRSIVFTGKGVFWDCQSALWDGENMKIGESDAGTTLRAEYGSRFADRWWPDFGFYRDIICSYNGRNFTYPQDGLDGISATLRALSPAFPGGFVAGLPRVFFNHALLWQPFGIAEQRRHRTRDGNLIEKPTGLPTWSWCAWQCYVDPWSLVSGSAYIAEDEAETLVSSLRTHCLVQWYASHDAAAKSELIQEALDFQDLSTKGFSEPPNGWLKHQHPSGNKPNPFHFTAQPHETPKFAHPIPLNIAGGTVKFDVAPPYLLGSTTSASFGAAAVLAAYNGLERHAARKAPVFEDIIFTKGPPWGKHCSVLVLRQRSGSFAGLLRLMDVGTPPKGDLTLVAISAGTVNQRDLRKSFEYKVYMNKRFGYRGGLTTIYYESELLSQTGRKALDCSLDVAFGQRASEAETTSYSDPLVLIGSDNVDDHAGDVFTCEFYNVLWVEQKEGISYRKACGWVPKHIWDLNAKEMDVILG